MINSEDLFDFFRPRNISSRGTYRYRYGIWFLLKSHVKLHNDCQDHQDYNSVACIGHEHVVHAPLVPEEHIVKECNAVQRARQAEAQP